MNVNIDDVLYDYNKSKINKLLFQISIECNYFGQKIFVYNPKSNIPLQKFWIKINKCRIFSIDDNILTLVFAYSKKDKKFIKFVNVLTKKINDYCKQKINQNIEVISKLSNDNNTVPTLDVTISDASVLLNNNEQKIIKNKLKKMDIISLFLELDHLYLNNDKVYMSWRIIQLKLINDINPEISLFSNFSNIISHTVCNSQINSIIRPPIPPPPPPPPLPISLSASNKQNNTLTLGMTGFVPNKNDLLNAMSKLKKADVIKETKDNDILLSEQKPNNSIPKIIDILISPVINDQKENKINLSDNNDQYKKTDINIIDILMSPNKKIIKTFKKMKKKAKKLKKKYNKQEKKLKKLKLN